MRGITEERLIELMHSSTNKRDVNFIYQLISTECQELNQLQPIDKNTPKDRQIILYTKEYGLVIGKWFTDDRTGWWTAHCMPVTPTHWMELPDQPK